MTFNYAWTILLTITSNLCGSDGRPRGSLTRRAREYLSQSGFNTQESAIGDSLSPEIADSNDGRAVDDGTDKRLSYFVFDVFAEDVDGLVNDV
jgi:hypothetical protein